MSRQPSMSRLSRKAGLSARIAELQSDTRVWLHIDSTGQARKVQVNKHELVRSLQLPYRDLRTVDPEVPIPFPSGILIRDRALVVKLESIGMIITREEVYVTSAPTEDDFAQWEQASSQNYFVDNLLIRLQPPDAGDAQQHLIKQHHLDANLPYQLKALEAALFTATQELGYEVDEIISCSSAPLKALSGRISRNALETVRQVKSDMMQMSSRVNAIKRAPAELSNAFVQLKQHCLQELEEILDDDQDMADMYLGKPTTAGPGDGLNQEDVLHKITPQETMPHPDTGPPKHSIGAHTHPAHPHEIEEAENLLESYLMRMEYMLNQLEILKEHIDDCEDVCNIELDARRNELVALDMVISSLTASFAFVSMIAGIFGMNLDPLPIMTTQAGFWSATFGSIFIGICIFVSVMLYCWQYRLLFIPKISVLLNSTYRTT